MLFDVILPIAGGGVFTYSLSLSSGGSALPEDLPLSLQGMRVLVPFGARKLLTGILWREHRGELPEGVKIKQICNLPDETPLVTPAQIALWEWVSSYYMCGMGEVMKAAVPAVLRPESETRVSLHPAFRQQDLSAFSPSRRRMLSLLADGKERTLADIGKELGIAHILPALRELQEAGAVCVGEELSGGYKAKTEQWVEAAPAYRDNEQGMHILRNALAGARRQQQLLSFFLQLAGTDGTVRREELLSVSGCSPSVLKALVDRGVLLIRQKPVEETQAGIPETETLPPHPLSDEQQTAFDDIVRQWDKKEVVLLHGVTGSGKTELYIHLIRQTLEQGKQALFLVPEIALTAQLTERLRSIFGSALGVYHSRFSDRERAATYFDLLQQHRCRVVLGVRSSVFLPFSRLGLVIVDEEHDAGYKQQEPAPRYHARHTALMLAACEGAKTLLGTATPAIETYYNAMQGKYGLVELRSRHSRLPLPDIRLVDLRRCYHRKEITGHFSDCLVQRIGDDLRNNRQVIVFQNRRGYAPWLECRQCACVPKCVHCDVSLTLHKRQGTLVCHYCGYTIPLPDRCPVCGQQGTMTDRGVGTEKAEDELRALFPEARIARMDLDTTRSRYAHLRLIDDFGARRTDILVGTQMLAKGLHFDNVATVAVLNADTLLNRPDFRSYEHAFQMLEQVSGRAGRTLEKGEVIIQTSVPESDLLRFVVEHDYQALYHAQIRERKAFRYPPFCRLLAVTVRHRDLSRTERVASRLQALLKAVFTHRCSQVILPPVSRIQSLHQRQILLKIESDAPYAKAKELLRNTIANLQETDSESRSVSIQVDVDPV